jgi:hypothetical protein
MPNHPPKLSLKYISSKLNSYFDNHLSFLSKSFKSENFPSISVRLISFHYFDFSLLNFVNISGKS